MHGLPLTLFVWLFAALSTTGVLMPPLVCAQGNAQRDADAPEPAHVRRPYRGLFAGPADPDSSQALTLSASAFGAYDDNVFAAVTNRRRTFDRRLQSSGLYSGAQAGLNYDFSRSGSRGSVAAVGGAHATYYRFDAVDSIVPHFQGGFSGRLALGRSTSLSGVQREVYSENYRLLFFPAFVGSDDADGAIAADPDLELFQRKTLRHATQVSLSHEFSRRSSMSFGYHHRYVDFLDGEAADFRSQGASAAFRQRLTSHTALNLGYGYHEGYSIGGRRRIIHNVDAGVSYSRALSFSRRTFLSFSSGSAIVVSENLTTSETDPRTRFRLIGNSSLVHELGRTWTAQLGYHRALVFREGFDEPFFTDGVIAGIGGLASRRVELSVLAGWSGSTLDRPGRTKHNAAWASAQARYALSRYLALYARYVYYQFDFGADVPLDPDFPRTLDRQGVRVGITTSIPLIR